MAHRRALTAASLAVVAMAAACGSSKPVHDATSPSAPTSTTRSASSSPSSTSPAPSTSNPTATTVEQTVQAAWLNYWKVSLALTEFPRSGWPARVKAIAVDPIYSELLNSVRAQQDKLGEVGFGYVISHPYWPSPPTTSTKTVVMGDCFDGSHAGTKLASSGKIKTVGKTQTNIHATFVKGGDGMWRVHQIQYLKASC